MTQESIITYLSEKLLEKINKKGFPSTRFFRLAICDDFRKKGGLDMEKLKYPIQNGVKKRLEGINIPNVDDVENCLLTELKKNQPLLTMAIF